MTRLVRLGSVADFVSGFAFKSSAFNTDGNGLPLVRIRDVVPGRSNTFYAGEHDSRFLVEDGDVLIGMDGEFNLGRWAGGIALLNQRVCKLGDVDPALDRAYLVHFLPNALKAIEDATPFATVKHLSIKSLREIQIPLPPLDEQRRIAAILDQADTLRDKRHQSVFKLESLSQSIFLEMFGEGDWERRSVEEVAAPERGSIRTGPFGSQLRHSEFVDEGIAVLGIDNVVTNQFQWSKRRFITPDKYEKLKRYTVSPGDVLITIMGTCGRCAVVPNDIPTAINTKHLCAITVDNGQVLPEFLRACFLWYPESRRFLLRRAKGSIMDGLNMGIIKEMPMTVPPLELQRAFVERIRAVEGLHPALASSGAEVARLLNALQQRAFSGRL